MLRLHAIVLDHAIYLMIFHTPVTLCQTCIQACARTSEGLPGTRILSSAQTSLRVGFPFPKSFFIRCTQSGFDWLCLAGVPYMVESGSSNMTDLIPIYMSVQVPYTEQEWKNVRVKFIASIAKVAGVKASLVTVTGWRASKGRRRLFATGLDVDLACTPACHRDLRLPVATGLDVDLEIKVDKSAAVSTRSKLTLALINLVLKADGLKEITKITKDATMSHTVVKSAPATRVLPAVLLLFSRLLPSDELMFLCTVAFCTSWSWSILMQTLGGVLVYYS